LIAWKELRVSFSLKGSARDESTLCCALAGETSITAPSNKSERGVKRMGI
jgi:hypothetical protein